MSTFIPPLCRRFVLLASVGLALAGTANTARADQLATAARACSAAIDAAERNHDIPAGLLKAIGLTEARRGDVIWPWTINRGGRARYFATRTAAETRLRRYLDYGDRNIDAGCLQLNIQWAGKGLGVAELLEPALNADRAARYLARLYAEDRRWSRAIGHYHTRKAAAARSYFCRVAVNFVKVRREMGAQVLGEGGACPSDAFGRLLSESR